MKDDDWCLGCLGVAAYALLFTIPGWCVLGFVGYVILFSIRALP